MSEGLGIRTSDLPHQTPPLGRPRPYIISSSLRRTTAPDKGLYLYIGEVHFVNVRQHLADLSAVLEHSTSGLRQMVQRCVSAQYLCKGTDSIDLQQMPVTTR